MPEHHCCSCGFAAPTAAELTDHLHEVFSLADDSAGDGQQHTESARDEPAVPVRCLCGYQAADVGDLDQHILAAYTPPDAVAPDGVRHVQDSA
jgi:hypothetical protein